MTPFNNKQKEVGNHLFSAIQSLAGVRMSLRLAGQLDENLKAKLEELHNEILKKLEDNDK